MPPFNVVDANLSVSMATALSLIDQNSLKLVGSTVFHKQTLK